MPDMRQEIVTKVSALVDTRFGGNWSIAFSHYADNGNDRLGLVGVVHLLEDARVGRTWTRTPIGRAIIRAMDQNGDGAIGWAEFRAYLETDA